jgi:rhamnulose-1-phosphate aldolase/alcohol dehydrogenase
MQNLWNDAEAAQYQGLDLLVYASRLVGQDTSLVVWGGGNTSLKLTEIDFTGEPVEVMRVKGSGSDLKTIQPKDFPGVRLKYVLPLEQREDMSDEEMVAYLTHCLMEPSSPRPSIETLLHAFIPYRCIIHTHADAILALCNTEHGTEWVRHVYGRQAALIPYRRPGFLLSKQVAAAVKADPEVRLVILDKHGLITWGETPKEAYLRTVEAVNAAEEFARAQRRVQVAFGGPARPALPPEERRRVAAAVMPALRGALSRERRAILRFDDSDDVLEFVNSREVASLSQIGPATPDHLMNTKRVPCVVTVDDPSDTEALRAALVEAAARYAEQYRAYVARYRRGDEPALDPYPRVVLVPGLGMFTAGRDVRAAQISADIYHHTIRIMRAATGFDRYVSLSEKDCFDVEYWPLELYKLTLAPPEKELSRRIALITGAGSGIGKAIALRFAQEGAHVVVTDIDGASATAVAEVICHANGAGRAVGLQLDVTNEAQVQEVFAEAVRTYGGLDILVSNAGIAPAADIEHTSLRDWQRSLDVNATGHFLVTREAIRILKQQGIGGSLVYIATKNVLAPGREFGAYSAAKAAEAQLCRVVAIECGEYGIRANMVNPDAVFKDSRLWSPELRRRRAEAHGISEEELQEFYRKRNLLQVPVFPEDVAEAALWLASDRSCKTTGAMIPVDGGVREAFAR